MSNEKTGVLIIGDTGNNALNSFPREFKRGFFSRVDPHFALIVLGCFIVVFGIFAGLSMRKPSEVVTEKEIEKIQERYARLVLNQPKPEIKEKKDALEKTVKEKEIEKQNLEEEKKPVQVDREKETFIDKQRRKEASTEERRQKREMVAQQIQSSGIFAAITSSGNSSGSAADAASDLLGVASENMADIGEINVAKGAFVTKSVSAEELKQRTSRTTDVSIQKQDVGKADIVQVASTATVNISSKPPEVTGESASHADRSQSTIQKIVNRETQRLKRVFEDWLKRDPALGGNLTIKFVILPSGAVSSVNIVKSTTNNSAFDETIVRYIKRWQFPEVVGGSPVEVVYPFVFEGQS